ncbi:proline-rich protein 36-like [Grus japonensis]|uniref:Proline-rich protein 36-like n=1 Tax=Grus japonensis TaxID=30415 RepID=A0ABC9XXJ3_GRUJA
MGTHVLILVLGHPELRPQDGLWVLPDASLSLRCTGQGPFFLLLRSGTLVSNVSSSSGFVTFSDITDNVSGVISYTCRCQNPPSPPGKESNTVTVVVSDPHLDPPKLSLLPAPSGGNVSVMCEGPLRNGTFQLYRGGPGGAMRLRWVAGGGAASFSLGPLGPQDEGPYVCTYSPDSGGVSRPSLPLMLLVEGGSTTPSDPGWPGCEYLGGSP